VIEDCTLGNNVLVRQSCVLAESTIADGARIGPSRTCVRVCEIGEDAHVGNFVETKKAKLDKGAKATTSPTWAMPRWVSGPTSAREPSPATTTGVRKHITRIGKEAFVGSNSTWWRR